MFTGIIEEKGHIKSISIKGASGSLMISAKKVLEGTKIGDSIAVNGVCLTVTQITSDGFCADVMAETLRQTSLGKLGAKSPVNLERAMAAGGRFGGHIVSGHIDGTGRVESLVKEENATWVTVKASPEILRYIISRGSITIDGMSLTVAYVDDSVFKVSIIPHTAESTTILEKRPGDTVNLETDIVARYVEKLMKPAPEGEEKRQGITLEALLEEGF